MFDEVKYPTKRANQRAQLRMVVGYTIGIFMLTCGIIISLCL